MFELNKFVFYTRSFVKRNYISGYFLKYARNISNMNCDSVDTKWSRMQNVSDYYAGKKILVTGGTGFLGKVLIERLLMNCSEIESVYVLIREKRGTSAQVRLQEALNVPIFDKLKQVRPEAIHKIIPIKGDISETGLGMTLEDEQKLIKDVSIVFHAAANVKFNKSFKTMLEINVEGTRRVMDLSKKIKKLEAFLYFSTAFANSNRKTVDEVIYPTPMNLHEVYNIIEKHSNNLMETIKQNFGIYNSYSFSKFYCEHLVDLEHDDMPTIIVRPSLVTPILKEPLPGWSNSWSGATGLFSDVARGMTKVIYGQEDVICDIIPVDYVINLAIIAAARGNRSSDVIVYSSSTGSSNPITWKRGLDLFLEESLKRSRSPGTLKPRKVFLAKSQFVVSLLTFTRQTFPAILADFWLLLERQKPMHLKMQRRAVLARDLKCELTRNSWLFKSDNSMRLMASMNDEEKMLFMCDPKTIIWKNYIPIFYNGVQKYLLKN